MLKVLILWFIFFANSSLQQLFTIDAYILLYSNFNSFRSETKHEYFYTFEAMEIVLQLYIMYYCILSTKYRVYICFLYNICINLKGYYGFWRADTNPYRTSVGTPLGFFFHCVIRSKFKSMIHTSQNIAWCNPRVIMSSLNLDIKMSLICYYYKSIMNIKIHTKRACMTLYALVIYCRITCCCFFFLV